MSKLKKYLHCECVAQQQVCILRPPSYFQYHPKRQNRQSLGQKWCVSDLDATKDHL